MVKYIHSVIPIALVGLLLSACSNTTPQAEKNNSQEQLEAFSAVNERVLIASASNDTLILHYKKLLSNNPNQCLTYQLAEAYLNKGDTETALFHLNRLHKLANLNTSQGHLKTNEQPEYTPPRCNENRALFEGEVALLKANAYYQQHDNELAISAVKQVLSSGANEAEAYNVYGMLLADNGNIKEARNVFNHARALMYDDIIIKNNLAVLDIAEQNYDAAISKLLPLYHDNQHDGQLKANLILAMARGHHFQSFKSLLSPTKSPDEIADLYQNLNSAVALLDMPSNLENQHSTKKETY
jgi:tight adherence protein D